MEDDLSHRNVSTFWKNLRFNWCQPHKRDMENGDLFRKLFNVRYVSSSCSQRDFLDHTNYAVHCAQQQKKSCCFFESMFHHFSWF